VVNNPPLIGAVNVGGHFTTWALLGVAAWRLYLAPRLAVDLSAAFGAAWANVRLTNTAGVVVTTGEATVPAGTLRAAVLYALTDTLRAGPFASYNWTGRWNASLASGAPVGIGPGQSMQFGFALLADIDTFFLIEAAKGDRRQNQIAAPRVPLFPGR
jgi:hypothetical protein